MTKSKLKWIVLLAGIIVIIALTVYGVNQVTTNEQEMLEKSEECLQKNGTVVVDEGGFLSLPTVICE